MSENTTVPGTNPAEAPAGAPAQGTPPTGAPVELTVQDLGVIKSKIGRASCRERV